MANVKTQLIVEGVNRTAKAFREVDLNLKDLSSAAKTAGAAIAASLSVAVVASWVKGSIDAADAARKNAQAVGLAVEEYTALQYAASLAGVETGTLNGALSRLNRTVAEAAAGAARPSQAFKQLGVDVRDSAGVLKASDVILAEVADRFQEMPDGIQKSATAMELFGRSGAQLIPLLNGGAEGLAELRKEAEALGVVIGEDAAAQAEVFNDNLTRIGAAADGAANKVSADLLPSLVDLSELLVDVNKNTDASSVIATALGGALKILASIVLGVGAAFSFTGNLIGGLAAAMAALTRGEVRQAGDILKTLAEDNIKVLEDSMDRIGKLYSDSGDARAKDLIDQKKNQQQERAANAAHAEVVKSQYKQLVDAVKERSRAVQAAERAANNELKKVRDERLKIEQRYKEALTGLSGESEASYGGAQALKVGARNALRNGDIESAKAQAQAALKMLQDLAAAGESTYGFEGFIRELEAVELAANDIEQSNAEAKIKSIKDQMAALEEQAKTLENMKLSIEPDQASLAAASSAIQQLAKELGEKLTIPVTIAAPSSAPTGDTPGYASGGIIRGPGSGTSDSILARLSNGEFVMRAAAVKHYGPQLMAMMNGLQLPKFADGGLVEAAAAVQPSGPGRDLGRVELALPGGEKLSLLADGENFDRIVRRTAMKRGRTRVN